MIYMRRELRRLWAVNVYVKTEDSSPPTDDTEQIAHTIIAWNEVDAIRLAPGDAATRPEAICFVTWPEEDGDPIYRVNHPTTGPTDEEINPTVPLPKDVW